MTYLQQALVAFWKSLGHPVYLQGRVPKQGVLPYTTMTFGVPAPMQQITLTAFVWSKDSGSNAYKSRAEDMERVAQMIPQEGVLLELPDGYAELNRNPSDFISVYDDPDTTTNIIGFRIAYTLKLLRN